MDKTTLQTRLNDLRNQHQQLTNMAEQAKQQSLMVAGHINEITHWLEQLNAIEQSTPPVEAKKKRVRRKPVTETTNTETNEPACEAA